MSTEWGKIFPFRQPQAFHCTIKLQMIGRHILYDLSLILKKNLNEMAQKWACSAQFSNTGTFSKRGPVIIVPITLLPNQWFQVGCNCWNLGSCDEPQSLPSQLGSYLRYIGSYFIFVPPPVCNEPSLVQWSYQQRQVTLVCSTLCSACFWPRHHLNPY
jgi:hypothetical protein